MTTFKRFNVEFALVTMLRIELSALPPFFDVCSIPVECLLRSLPFISKFDVESNFIKAFVGERI